MAFYAVSLFSRGAVALATISRWFFVSAEVFLVGVFLGFRSLFTHTRVVPSVKAPAERRTNFFCFFFALPDSTRASAYMSNRERNRIIDEALAAPPPPPEQCALRTLSFARDVKTRKSNSIFRYYPRDTRLIFFFLPPRPTSLPLKLAALQSVFGPGTLTR